MAKGLNKGKEGDYRGSIEDYTNSIALVENANSYFKRGYAYLFLKDYPMAVQDFIETLRIIPDHKEAILGMGIARF